MAAITSEAAVLRQLAPAGRPRFLDAVWRVFRTPVGGAAVAVILTLILMALVGSFIAPYDYLRPSIDTYADPSLDHWLGTDNLGRDTLSRLIRGTRISIYAGLLTVTFGTIAGSVVGLTSGFLGGRTDLVVQRVVDAIQAIPALLMTMAIISVLSPSTTNAVLAIAVFVSASNSRVIRGAVFSVKQNVYVEAAEVIGASPARRMLRHVLPNVMPPILILISAGFGAAILIEGALSFLGLATQLPEVSWGIMLRDGRLFMEDQPWMAISAGTAIAISVLSFNLLGDVIRDVIDPRLRGSR